MIRIPFSELENNIINLCRLALLYLLKEIIRNNQEVTMAMHIRDIRERRKI